MTLWIAVKSDSAVNKRAMRPWIAHLSIQAKNQTFNFEIWVTFDQGQRMTLTFDTHSTLLIQNATYKVSMSSVSWFWRRKFFKIFQHIWAWRPCWSCDPTHLYIFWFIFSLKHLYEFWFQIAQLFLRKTSFNFEIWVTFDQSQEWPWPLILIQLHKLI